MSHWVDAAEVRRWCWWCETVRGSSGKVRYVPGEGPYRDARRRGRPRRGLMEADGAWRMWRRVGPPGNRDAYREAMLEFAGVCCFPALVYAALASQARPSG